MVGWLVWGDIYSVHIVEDEVRFGQTNVSKLICYDFVGVVLLIFVVGWTRAINANTYKKKYRENRNINAGS